MYGHPHHPVSSIRLSPVNFYGHHYEREMESLPHPINENSNQSLLTNKSQKNDEGKLSQQYDQIQSPYKASCRMSFFQSLLPLPVQHLTTLL